MARAGRQPCPLDNGIHLMEICDVLKRISRTRRMSALMPASSVPISFSRPRCRAATEVAALSASLLGQPHLDQSLDLLDGCQSRQIWPGRIRADHNSDTRLVKLREGLQFGLEQGLRRAERGEASER